MKERGIIFCAPMVRAILAGAKTQTRRIVKGDITTIGAMDYLNGQPLEGCSVTLWQCPYGGPGDRLWVRETWRHTSATMDEARAFTEDIMSGTAVRYRANDPNPDFETWRPSIHMPRWASRITLEITGVRVERLQDISEADAIAEGCARADVMTFDGNHELVTPEHRRAYARLWDSINGSGSWDANPWVWVIEFRRIAK